MSSVVRDIETLVGKMGYSDEKAERIYYAHVKPLETALAKAEADKAALVYALEAAADYIGDESCGSSEFWDKYRAALARVKGEA